MSAITEAPSAYRHSSIRPGSIGLIQEAIREVSSRRRLIQYLVQADLKKKGSDTLLGNLWWVIDPLLQMLVYVVLVSVIMFAAIEAIRQRVLPNHCNIGTR